MSGWSLATRTAQTNKKNVGKNLRQNYYFDVGKCKICPFREGCYTEEAKIKTYSVTINSIEHKDQEPFKIARNLNGKQNNNYDLNEGIKIKKHKVKPRFRSELNEISPFFKLN